MPFDSLKNIFYHLLPKKTLTVLTGMLADVRQPAVKNALIRAFVRSYQVKLEEAVSSEIADYACFNDFFIRHLKPEVRPLDNAPVIAPVDGILSELGTIDAGVLLQAKGKYYTLDKLLQGNAMAKHFQSGSYATLYLSPKDYHRVHMPLEGHLLETIYVPGQLFSVQAACVRTISDLFARNERFIAFFDTPLGLMAMVLVGATIVGAIASSWAGEIKRSRCSIRVDYRGDTTHPQPRLPQGGEMGYFKLGSTVILLFAEQKNIQWKANLIPGQPIHFGEAMVE